MGGIIQKNSKVVKINREKDTITSVEVERDGRTETLKGDILISSMPLKDLVGGMEQVPEEIAAIADGLPYRDFVTVGVLTRRLNLKNETNIKTLNDIVPDCWI